MTRCECGDSECPSCGTAQGTRAIGSRELAALRRELGWVRVQIELMGHGMFAEISDRDRKKNLKLLRKQEAALIRRLGESGATR